MRINLEIDIDPQGMPLDVLEALAQDGLTAMANALAEEIKNYPEFANGTPRVIPPCLVKKRKKFDGSETQQWQLSPA